MVVAVAPGPVHAAVAEAVTAPAVAEEARLHRRWRGGGCTGGGAGGCGGGVGCTIDFSTGAGLGATGCGAGAGGGGRCRRRETNA